MVLGTAAASLVVPSTAAVAATASLVVLSTAAAASAAASLVVLSAAAAAAASLLVLSTAAATASLAVLSTAAPADTSLVVSALYILYTRILFTAKLRYTFGVDVMIYIANGREERRRTGSCKRQRHRP